ncbi:MAG: ORF6N domain-containing protein, partial [Bacteroidales bacterium]|nr:ORF6N domain-containing protein [Bacteroidales bacterium]
TSRWGGARYLPYAFTEQGIYMLMTVLKGDLAVRQSKALIKLFKQMKDYILQNQSILSSSELLKLSIQTHNNTEEIRQIKQQMVTRNDISTIIKDFTDPCIKKDYLFYNGQTVEAALAYAEIYSSAKKSIYIVDNYIGLKTLLLLKSVANNVKVTIFSDNANKGLHLSELKDFRYEYPNIDITLKTTGGIYHDRYIIIDPNTNSETIYHCGGSSKDGGKRITSITKVEDKMLYRGIIETLQDNPTLQI